MKTHFALSAALAAIPLTAQPQTSDESYIALLAELSDPEFWSIVDEGPSNSSDLKRVVTVFAANQMHDEATDIIVDYLLREEDRRDPFCDYCVSLLATAERTDQDPHVEYFFEAVDVILEQAYEEESGENLVAIAVMYAVSRNAAIFDRGLYILTNAVRLGVDDRSREHIVGILVLVRHLELARTVAVEAYEDHRSIYYQASAAKEWIEFIDSEIERRDVIDDFVLAGDWRH